MTFGETSWITAPLDRWPNVLKAQNEIEIIILFSKDKSNKLNLIL